MVSGTFLRNTTDAIFTKKVPDTIFLPHPLHSERMLYSWKIVFKIHIHHRPHDLFYCSCVHKNSFKLLLSVNATNSSDSAPRNQKTWNPARETRWCHLRTGTATTHYYRRYETTTRSLHATCDPGTSQKHRGCLQGCY